MAVNSVRHSFLCNNSVYITKHVMVFVHHTSEGIVMTLPIGRLRCNAQSMFPLFQENQKSIPNLLGGEKPLENVTLQILNFIPVS